MKKLRTFLLFSFFSIFFVGCVTSGNSAKKNTNDSKTSSLPVQSFPTNESDSINFGFSYPPVKTAEHQEFTKKHAEKLGIQHVRFSVHWKFIEPQKRKFSWKQFDSQMEFMEKNNLSLLLTIEGNGPQFVCSKQNKHSCVYKNSEDFETFVEKLLTRYPNQIDTIQFGNEMLDPAFYMGSAEEYITFQNILYSSVQKYSPKTSVSLGGFSAAALRRFAVCETKNIFPLYYNTKILQGKDLQTLCAKKWVRQENNDLLLILKKAKYDIADIHLYDDVENWKKIFESFASQIPNTPIIISEFGGPFVYNCTKDLSDCNLGPTETKEKYSSAYHSTRMKKYIETIQSFPVLRAYHFALVDLEDPKRMHARSGLLDSTGTKKPVYDVFLKAIQE